MFELIPLKSKSLLTSRKAKLNALKLMLNILNESIEACEDFLNKKYTAFDAQVGETSCQIRAYKICLLAGDCQFNLDIQKFIPQILEYKKNIINHIQVFENNINIHSSYFRELDYKESKENFFNKLQTPLSIKNDYLFIILSHFLRKYCCFDYYNVPNAIDYDLIRKIFDIGSTPARKLANRYQSLLSSLSCEFVLQQSAYVAEIDKNNNLLFLQLLLKAGDSKRQMLPYYYVTKVLLSSMATVDIPIIFSLYNRKRNKSEPLILFFKKDDVTNKMVLRPTLSDVEQHTPAIIYQGDVLEDETLSFNGCASRILQAGVKKIILLNAASHPQYAGESLNNYVTDPYKDIIPTNQELEQIIALNNEEFNKARIEAELMGCSQNNASLFFIKHIFCSSFYDEYSTLFYGDELCMNQKHQTIRGNVRMSF